MRILFMGTPDFAVASLKRLVEDGHDVCGVFTQPDKPKNRGHKMAFSPVKEYALIVGLPVYQPMKMRDGEASGIVRELAPELIVVAAYGRILPEDILSTPAYGSINVLLRPAEVPGRGAHQLGYSQRGQRHRRYHHVYGQGAGRRGCDPLPRDGH
mgnify:CR=1 FL=1